MVFSKTAPWGAVLHLLLTGTGEILDTYPYLDNEEAHKSLKTKGFFDFSISLSWAKDNETGVWKAALLLLTATTRKAQSPARRPTPRQQPTCAANEPPELACATTKFWASRATNSLRSVAICCVNRTADATPLTTASSPLPIAARIAVPGHWREAKKAVTIGSLNGVDVNHVSRPPSKRVQTA